MPQRLWPQQVVTAGRRWRRLSCGVDFYHVTTLWTSDSIIYHGRDIEC